MLIPEVAAPFLKSTLQGEAHAWPAGLEPEPVALAVTLQGAAGLVYQALKPTPDGATRGPDTGAGDQRRLVDLLAPEAMGIAALNAVRLRELARPLVDLHDAGIEVVALKGLALLATVYEHAGLRPMVDVDLLVDESSMERSAAVLEGAGFRRAAVDAPGEVHHWAFLRSAPGGVTLMVEVHKRLFAVGPYDRLAEPAGVLARARSVAYSDLALRVPDPIDLALHVAGHLTVQHARGERLVWVADLDRAVRAIPADGHASLWERAADWGLTPALNDALEAAGEWLGTPYPHAVPNDSPRDAPSGLRDPGRTYARARRRAPVGLEGARLLDAFRARKGVAGKLALARAYALPSPAYMRDWYRVDRSWKLPYYYIVRLLRGLGDIIEYRRPARRVTARPPAQWLIEPTAADRGDD